MSAREITQWRRFYRRYPFDDMNAFHRGSAQVVSALININSPKRQEPAHWKEFVPFVYQDEKPEPAKPAAELTAKMQMATRWFKNS
jgi:hypothetical protein